MKTYSNQITSLKPNEIFVFGSNTEGRHGLGAAKWAMKFGAKNGKAFGLQGQTYAIITKNLKSKSHPSVSKGIIISQIIGLYKYAEKHPELDFLVAYSTEPNLNGYTPEQMADMFKCGSIPNNIVFEHKFSKLLTGVTTTTVK